MMSVFHQTSVGQALSETSWLDDHFEASRPEYEAMLRSVGIKPGWRVLDAGCGGGTFLPLLSELVGPHGHITALDLAPENVAVVARRSAAGAYSSPITAEVGSITELPFPDRSFDAVWCANVLQYLGDDQLVGVLKELGRVVRPGGVVAVKDTDMQLLRLFPADPFLVDHLIELSTREPWSDVQSIGSLRGRELRRWLERAGLEDVQQRTTLIERWAPLQPAERRLWANWLAYLGRLAHERGAPVADLQHWRVLQDPDHPENPLNNPEFYACEGQVLATGRVPDGAVGERP